jgi:hypothetical protein
MTIRPAEVSKESVEAVREHLSEIAARPEFPERALTGSAPWAVSLSAAHEVYSAGVDELAAGRGLASASPVAHGFLVMEGSNAIASVEQDTEGGGVSSTEGPFADATARAIERAEEDPRLADGEYELRALRVPGLYLMAVWLKDLNGDGDVVIPLDPAPAPLEAGRSYGLQELEPELASMSRERLSFEEGDE